MLSTLDSKFTLFLVLGTLKVLVYVPVLAFKLSKFTIPLVIAKGKSVKLTKI